MCDCKSYNKQIGTVPEVILPRPAWMREGERINGIPVDACIAPVVQKLWDNGIITLGSCCGHNTARPSVIVNQDVKDFAMVRRIILENDPFGRTWQILQWQLVEV